MSAYLFDSNGRIQATGSNAIFSTASGLPYDSSGLLCVTDSTTIPAYYANGLPFGSDNRVAVDSLSAINNYTSGYPASANGRLCVDTTNPVVNYSDGFPRALNGIAMSGNGIGIVFLPSTSSTKSAVFAPNLVVANYTGPLYRLVRTSDSVTYDVMPSSGGWPDNSAMDAFASETNRSTSEVCNQFGTGIGDSTNIIQSTSTIRPSVASSNVPSNKRPFGCHTLANSSGLANIVRLRIPTTISLSRQNFGVHAVMSPRNCMENRAYLSFDNGTTGDYEVLYSNSTNGTGTNPGLTTAKARSQVQAIGFTGSASVYKTYKDGTVLTGSASSAQTMNGGGNIGGSNGDTTFTSQADYYSITLFSTTPTDADMVAMNTWASQVYPLPTATPTKRLVYSGSSLITSWYSTLGQTALFQMGLDYNTWDAFADGNGGQSLAAQYAARATDVNLLYDATKAKNVLVIDAPSNDIAGDSYANQAAAESAADSIYNTVTLPFVSAWKALGVNTAVVVPTVIARGGFDTTTNFRQYALLRYNSNVTSGAVANGYTASNRYGDSRLQNPSDGTYYNLGDNTHLINAGYAVMASIDKAAILVA